MFLKNLLLSLGVIGVSTLHFANVAHAASLHEYYSNYQAFPMSFPNETYFPTCTAPASGPWSGVGYLGGYFSIK